MITDAHDAQTDRDAATLNAASTNTLIFSKTDKVVILVGAGKVGRAFTVAFTYVLETDPVVATKIIKKLTLHARYTQIVPHTSSFKPDPREGYHRSLF